MSISSYNTVTGPFVAQDIATATIGPALVGALFNLIFFGVALDSVWNYFQSSHYKKDPWRIKGVVYAVLILASIQSSFEGYLVYRYGCTQQRGFTSLFTKTIIDEINTLFVGIEGMLVQSFLCIRAATLFSSPRWKRVFYGVAGLSIACGFIGSLLYWVISLMSRAGISHKALPLTEANSTLLWLTGAALADITVTISLVYNLRSKISGFNLTTDSVLKELVRIAVASAAYTMLFAVIPVILTISAPKFSPASNAAYFFPVPLSSLYLLSLLMNLNSRIKIKSIADGTIVSKYNPTPNRFGNFSALHSFENRPQQQQQSLSISYHTERHVLTEDARGTIKAETEDF